MQSRLLDSSSAPLSWTLCWLHVQVALSSLHPSAVPPPCCPPGGSLQLERKSSVCRAEGPAPSPERRLPGATNLLLSLWGEWGQGGCPLLSWFSERVP